MERVDLQTRTLYAELLEQLQILDASRTIAALQGSWARKELSGEVYLYFQHYLPGGKLHQIYVGKLNEQTEALLQEYEDGRIETQAMLDNIRRLTRQVVAGSGVITDPAMARVISSMADAGVFRHGGVLVGTHAYIAMSIMMGAVWAGHSMATTDIDLAANRHVAVAVPQVTADIPAAIDSLKMGFYPVPAMSLKQPSTTFAVRKSRLRLDIITPKTMGSDAPVFIKRFNCAAQPLSYLGFLIEKPIPAVILAADPILVTVPQPVRYALHKLIVSQLRDVSRSAKKEKDLLQAHQLLTILGEERPDEVAEVWESILVRGPKWKKVAEAGKNELLRRYPDTPFPV